MPKFALTSIAVVLALAAGGAGAGEFAGWEVMLVIEQKGRAHQCRVADLDGDGRHEIMVINTSQARIDLYRWLPKEKRKDAQPPDPDEPNLLPPMPPELERQEISLEKLPRDLVAHDLDGDGKSELIVLVTPPIQVLILKQDDEGKWKEDRQWDLLPGVIAGRDHPMLLRPLDDRSYQLLISFNEGIQTLKLEAGSQPTWLSPRQQGGRVDWWLADLDGDGDQDLVEWTHEPSKAIRWYPCIKGELLPAQTLKEQVPRQVRLLVGAGARTDLLLLSAQTKGLLRRYHLGEDKPSPLGERRVIPVPDASDAVWCSMDLAGRRALVLLDRKQPRLKVYVLGPDGWEAATSFPVISKVRKLAAPTPGPEAPATLLLMAKDASDLHVSYWKDGRLSYPKPMPQSQDIEDRKILTLETAGKTIWWAQRVGEDVDLYVWEPGHAEPSRTHFKGLGKKTQKVVWLGGERLLFKQAYGPAAKLAVIENDKLTITKPSQLEKAEFSQFKLMGQPPHRKLVRLADGVLQWLGDDLHPEDQVMLPDGKRLVSFIALDRDQAWALEQGGKYMHLLRRDEAGILRPVDSVKLPGGFRAVDDPVLGLMLLADDAFMTLRQGKPRDLVLTESIDSRVGRPGGVKEATIGRLFTTDVTGDGAQEVILCDDRRHQLTVLAKQDDKLEPLISWKVFDDVTYPYGGGRLNEARAEPRQILGLDLDGDKQQDLVMLCHDRLLVYLAREQP